MFIGCNFQTETWRPAIFGGYSLREEHDGKFEGMSMRLTCVVWKHIKSFSRTVFKRSQHSVPGCRAKPQNIMAPAYLRMVPEARVDQCLATLPMDRRAGRRPLTVVTHPTGMLLERFAGRDQADVSAHSSRGRTNDLPCIFRQIRRAFVDIEAPDNKGADRSECPANQRRLNVAGGNPRAAPEATGLITQRSPAERCASVADRPALMAALHVLAVAVEVSLSLVLKAGITARSEIRMNGAVGNSGILRATRGRIRGTRSSVQPGPARDRCVGTRTGLEHWSAGPNLDWLTFGPDTSDVFWRSLGAGRVQTPKVLRYATSFISVRVELTVTESSHTSGSYGYFAVDKRSRRERNVHCKTFAGILPPVTTLRRFCKWGSNPKCPLTPPGKKKKKKTSSREPHNVRNIAAAWPRMAQRPLTSILPRHHRESARFPVGVGSAAALISQGWRAGDGNCHYGNASGGNGSRNGQFQGAAYRQYPQDTATLLGQPVTLYCSFSGLSPGDVVNWHWYNPSSEAKLYHISAGSLVAPEFSRYSIVGNAQRGEYNLYIQDTRQEDEGNYRCSVFSVRETKDIELKIIAAHPTRPRSIEEGPISPMQREARTFLEVGRIRKLHGSVTRGINQYPVFGFSNFPDAKYPGREGTASGTSPGIPPGGSVISLRQMMAEILPFMKLYPGLRNGEAGSRVFRSFLPPTTILHTYQQVEGRARCGAKSVSCHMRERPEQGRAPVSWPNLGQLHPHFEVTCVSNKQQSHQTLVFQTNPFVQEQVRPVVLASGGFPLHTGDCGRALIELNENDYIKNVPPPASPKITGPLAPRTEGKGLVLTCQSRGGRPLPKLVWYNGTTRQPPVRSVSRVQHRSEMVSSDLVLPFLTRWDNGANISCVADQGFPKIAPPRATAKFDSLDVND
ncbi:hypothetical protein Bbelb_005600 [Branchiostoma belcheri]|nr:hypothetical protein Bbelb_005600 [Branchiostoma belcheri]